MFGKRSGFDQKTENRGQFLSATSKIFRSNSHKKFILIFKHGDIKP